MLLEIGTGEARPYGARHWIPVALRWRQSRIWRRLAVLGSWTGGDAPDHRRSAATSSSSILPSSPPSPFVSVSISQLCLDWVGIPTCMLDFPPAARFPARASLCHPSISRLPFPFLLHWFSSRDSIHFCAPRFPIRAQWRPPHPPGCHKWCLWTPRRRLALEADAIDVLARWRGSLRPSVPPDT